MTEAQQAKQLITKHGIEGSLTLVYKKMDALRKLPYGIEYLNKVSYWFWVEQEIIKLKNHDHHPHTTTP